MKVVLIPSMSLLKDLESDALAARGPLIGSRKQILEHHFGGCMYAHRGDGQMKGQGKECLVHFEFVLEFQLQGRRRWRARQPASSANRGCGFHFIEQ